MYFMNRDRFRHYITRNLSALLSRKGLLASNGEFIYVHIYEIVIMQMKRANRSFDTR